ncbi:DUF4166 domain-containing protein [Brevibacterium spongiae]|uniref:DUF4166 domain-containing protein n=1 Tax=Brevibacterium spongiae TaxID=2909672 RepID=A0ABY5SQB5_9MICO|nr:DUF4166 domain-containing protein [Brevibacterium spongiae]UVI36752.1 DUF4166 domain-containing protein [Brevibacterium spongiae]
MSRETRSPYERALGSRVDELHPALRRYFAAIPAGSVGIGEGVFEVFGSERRWLRPLLAVARRCRVIVPGMHRGVPFRVENRTVSGRQTATRTMRLDSGEWSMVDAVSVVRGGVVDVLGMPSIVEAEFSVDVVDGGLRLNSSRIALRLGRLRVSVPKAVRPAIALNERFDDTIDRQRIDLVVDVPMIGRVYEYTGTFTYRIAELRTVARKSRCEEEPTRQTVK